jgi:hypothetical protein
MVTPDGTVIGETTVPTEEVIDGKDRATRAGRPCLHDMTIRRFSTVPSRFVRSRPARRIAFRAVALALALGGCKGEPGKDTPADPAKPIEGGATSGAAGGASADAVELPSLGLVMDAPAAGATVQTLTAGQDWAAGPPDVSVRAGKITIDIAAVTPTYAATLDAAKAQIQDNPNLVGRPKKSPFTDFKKFTKEAAIEGGWHLEYELEARMDNSTHHGVQIRKTIDGKAYQCGQNHHDPAHNAAVASACLSLRKQ